MITPIRTVLVPHTCARCGAAYEGAAASYLCPACRVSKPVERSYSLPLTAREEQVVKLVAEGLANKEVAWKLRLAAGTIKQNLVIVFRKTGATNRTELAIWW